MAARSPSSPTSSSQLIRPLNRALTSRWGAALLLGVLGTLSGCSVTYTAEIRNATSFYIDARMLGDKLVADPIELDAAIIPPGGVVTLGPASVAATDPVRLTVVPNRDRGNVPQRKTMSRGVSQFVIEHDGEPTYGALMLRLIDHSSAFRLGVSSDGE
jgi:hypothetical protein